MQTQEFRSGLLEMAAFLEAGRSSEATRLRMFANAFDGLTKDAVKKTVDKIKVRWGEDGAQPVYSAGLRRLLEVLEPAARAIGGAKFGDDLHLARDLFVGAPNGTDEAFTQAIKAALTPRPPKPKLEKKLKPDPNAVVREYADRLTRANERQQEFAVILDEIKQKSNVKGAYGFSKAKVTAIADMFLGYAFKYKDSAAAIEAMRRRQLQDAIQASKERALSKLGV